MKVIQVLGLATGQHSDVDGEYVMTFDPDAHEGGGALVTTHSAQKARKFTDAGAALEFWRQTSRICPIRLDGKPNRPLTAFPITIMEEPNDGGTHEKD